MPVEYGRAGTDQDLKEILLLQEKNLPPQLTEEIREREGFLTVSHTLDLLGRMNEVCPHIIARKKGRVVGYALCMHPDFSEDIPILRAMFNQIRASLPSGKTFMVMGQVCIDKDYRKQGIFRGLYRTMKEALSDRFDLIVTEVDGRNRRSLEAHLAIGFQVLKKYQSDGRDWYLIIL
ncbi:Ribosomal protein S18 acetylase RimI [Muriicola jejuensis]|uniref:GNAT family N-acetyltransferase n=1 Tax=Muriicola jejuensis TaxID=504488 RepID=A0A6P0UAK9_9FLAO|nr:GNAT family N-acetyltransferase [Muriicola jejuensis]NER10224.1 GNAT family N-acetyltransferase [Muriicola jejuensis]SMP02006.1 Ribosomal protein S18 acetylase RimI [Muriicola jejuensis]